MTLEVKIDKAESIRNYISQKIKTRDYVDRLPSLNQLAGHFNVNIKTAKRAVSELEQAGVLFSQKGKGTFVNQNNLHPAPFLFIGRENKEISGVIASVLASAVKLLDLNYCPYTFLIPQETAGKKFQLPKFADLAGIMVEGGLVDDADFENIDIPVIQLHSMSSGHDYLTVSPDVKDGIRQALDYLQSLGHKKIAYLGPELSPLCEELEHIKRNYFFEYAKQLNMIIKPAWNPDAYYRVKTGYEAAMKVLHAIDRPTAVVCVNDEVALGVLNACDELGVAVPAEFSVIGFDDRVPAVMRKPFLSSIKVDFKQIAIEGIKLMHHSIKNKNHSYSSDDNVVVPTSLIVRETTGRVPE